MSDERPTPLVPPEVDLRGYEFMPYYGDRLRDSDLNSRATDAEYRAAHNLWWSSWKQVPAASLPNDDVALCKLADLGRDLKAWSKVKDRALHGFTLCTDGRYYHLLISVLALDAWDERCKARARGKAGASKRWDRPGSAPSTKNDSKGEERKGKEPAAVVTTGSTKESAAAAVLIYPEKLTHADRQAVGEMLTGQPRAQEILDELKGKMDAEPVRNPMALLKNFVEQAAVGKFVPTHAPRVQVERELQQIDGELAAAGRDSAGRRVA